MYRDNESSHTSAIPQYEDSASDYYPQAAFEVPDEDLNLKNMLFKLQKVSFMIPSERVKNDISTRKKQRTADFLKSPSANPIGIRGGPGIKLIPKESQIDLTGAATNGRFSLPNQKWSPKPSISKLSKKFPKKKNERKICFRKQNLGSHRHKGRPKGSKYIKSVRSYSDFTAKLAFQDSKGFEKIDQNRVSCGPALKRKPDSKLLRLRPEGDVKEDRSILRGINKSTFDESGLTSESASGRQLARKIPQSPKLNNNNSSVFKRVKIKPKGKYSVLKKSGLFSKNSRKKGRFGPRGAAGGHINRLMTKDNLVQKISQKLKFGPKSILMSSSQIGPMRKAVQNKGDSMCSQSRLSHLVQGYKMPSFQGDLCQVVSPRADNVEKKKLRGDERKNQGARADSLDVPGVGFGVVKKKKRRVRDVVKKYGASTRARIVDCNSILEWGEKKFRCDNLEERKLKF